MTKQVLDHEKQIIEYANTIAKLKSQSQEGEVSVEDEISGLEKKLHRLKEKTYSNLSPWQRVLICRHVNRPHSIDYINNICDHFTELYGDRTFSDDQAIIGGLAVIDGKKFVIVAQEKGGDTEERIKRNFGMPHPEGYRKALRLMKLAEKFSLPFISLIDTPGAYPGLTAEERGQGWAIAKNLWEMAQLKTPIIVLIIGEGCSGGALGVGVGDVIGMLEHSYYSVISPEGCATILWKDAKMNAKASESLKMHVEDLLQFGIIDHVIKEPLGGAHHDPQLIYQDVKKYVLKQSKELGNLAIDQLLEKRYQKYRKLGSYEESS